MGHIDDQTAEQFEYEAFLNRLDEGFATPELDEFARWYAYDLNLVWRIEPGHIINLLDAAMDRLEENDLL